RFPVGDPEITLERPADNRLVERDAVWTSVRHRNNGEVALRHKQQLGKLAISRSAVADRVNAVYVAQEPADADCSAHVAAPQHCRRLLHSLEYAGGQDTDAVLSAAVAQMETGPPQLVRDRRCQAPTRVVASRASP